MGREKGVDDELVSRIQFILFYIFHHVTPQNLKSDLGFQVIMKVYLLRQETRIYSV